MNGQMLPGEIWPVVDSRAFTNTRRPGNETTTHQNAEGERKVKQEENKTKQKETTDKKVRTYRSVKSVRGSSMSTDNIVREFSYRFLSIQNRTVHESTHHLSVGWEAINNEKKGCGAQVSRHLQREQGRQRTKCARRQRRQIITPQAPVDAAKSHPCDIGRLSDCVCRI